MITALDLTLYRQDRDDAVLSGIDLHVGARDRIGIFGAQSSGKSTLARLIAGIERPDRGAVLRLGRIVGPLGFAGAYHPDMTGTENAEMVARQNGVDPLQVSAFAETFGELGDRMQARLAGYSPAERARLAFAVSMAFHGEVYLADEVIAVGDETFQLRCAALLAQRLDAAALILLSRNTATLERMCDRFFALTRGQIVSANSAEEAAAICRAAAEEERTAA